MPVYELRNETEHVRFLPGDDRTVTIFTYDGEGNKKGKSKTLRLNVARSYWKGLVKQGFRIHS